MQFNVSTTGINVTLEDLGVTLTHPETFDLLSDGLGLTDIIDSRELEEALEQGTLVATDEDGLDISSNNLGSLIGRVDDIEPELANKVNVGDNISVLTNDSNYITAASAPVQSVNGETGVLTDYAKTNLQNEFTESQSIKKTTGIASLGIDSDDNEATVIFRAGTPEHLWAIGADDFTDTFVIASTNGLSASREFQIESGEVDVYNKLIRNVVNPTLPQDAATKAYVDANAGSGQIFNSAAAAGSIDSAGSPRSSFNASILQLSTGQYRVNFTTALADDTYPIILSLEENAGTDDYSIKYENISASGFSIRITEQDDGGTGGVLVNSGFSFFIPSLTGTIAATDDHGALNGLGDDDHTQYALADGSRGNFATAAQGALADTALQSGDNISALNNDSGYITSAGLGNYFQNGGESTGAARSLGNNDSFNLSFKTNNVDRITIQPDGDIGFGISAPLGRFHAEGSVPTQEVFIVRGVSGQSDSYFEVRDFNNTDLFAVRGNGQTDFGFNRAINLGDPVAEDDAVPFKLLDAVKVRNTATGNLNTGVLTFSNFKTVDELGSTLGQFTLAANGITPNFTGVVRIDFNAEIFGSVARAVVGFRWSHNGSVGSWVRHTYIRNASGHTESSANFSTLIPVTSGQPIQIQHQNFAVTGTVTALEDAIEFSVQRIR